MTLRLTPRELADAQAWAEEHNRTIHDNKMDGADFAIRNLPGGGIGMHTVITCEACERVMVSNSNSHYVTDYDCW